MREDYAYDEDLLSHLEESKLNLHTHFNVYYAPSTPNATRSDPLPQPDAGSPQKVDFTSRYTQRVSASTLDELTEYFRITTVPEPFDGVDPLQWWYSRRRQFPNLYKLVRNILCIPGISLRCISLRALLMK